MVCLNLCYILAMKPEEIMMFFRDVSQHAESLLTRYNHYLKHRKTATFKEYQKPIVTVSDYAIFFSGIKLHFYTTCLFFVNLYILDNIFRSFWIKLILALVQDI